MTDVDANDPVAVAALLRRRAADRWEGAVGLVDTPTSVSTGFDSAIHLVHLRGDGLPEPWTRPLVVRVLPAHHPVDRAAFEAKVQAWCASAGYAVPQVLEVLHPDAGLGRAAQVMERAPGPTMLEALGSAPWRAGVLLRRLAALQVELHSLPTDGWPGRAEPVAMARQRLDAAVEVGTRRRVEALHAAVERAEGLIEVAGAGDLVVCHGDFHPLNVLIDGPRSAVVDWTDAGLAPREADVARTLLLFLVASIAAEGRFERAVLRAVGPAMLRRYQRAYERGAALHPERLHAWSVIHSLHGWSLLLDLADSDRDAGSVEVPLARLRARIGAGHAALGT